MKTHRTAKGGFALAAMLAVGLVAACEEPPMEQPENMPPGQAPMAEPTGSPEDDAGAEDMEREPGEQE